MLEESTGVKELPESRLKPSQSQMTQTIFINLDKTYVTAQYYSAVLRDGKRNFNFDFNFS